MRFKVQKAESTFDLGGEGCALKVGASTPI